MLFACAEATEATGIDGDAISGAPSGVSGADARAGAATSSGAGGKLGVSGAPSSSGGAPSSNGGALTSSGGAHQAGTSGAGADNGGANSAGRGGASAATGGAGGASAGAPAGGSSGAHDCKITVDLNGYTSSKPGCGGYTDCRGQIHWRNNEAQALTQITLAFSVASGVQCTGDNATSKWTLSDTGVSSHRCVFTALSGALTVAASSSLGFGFDTNQTDEALPSNIVVSDPACD